MTRIAWVLFLVLLFSGAALTQESPDFSGVYTLTSLKRSSVPKNIPKITVKVFQKSNFLEIAETVETGQTTTSRMTLDGRESKNVTSSGVPTVYRAEMKGKTLIIRSTVRLSNGVLVHETQKWELSADLKTLKIRRQTEFEGMSILDDTVMETYTRE